MGTGPGINPRYHADPHTIFIDSISSDVAFKIHRSGSGWPPSLWVSFAGALRAHANNSNIFVLANLLEIADDSGNDWVRPARSGDVGIIVCRSTVEGFAFGKKNIPCGSSILR